MKNLFLFCGIFFTIAAFSQQTERVEVQGEIIVPVGDEKEQISVYNTSSQKGTITDAEGKFTLKVAANDRVLITALQFQPFTVVVDQGVVDKKTMRILMNPAINQLEEVVVRPYDLSGNVEVDVKRLPVFEVPNYDLSYETITFDYTFTPDRLSKVEGNAAQDALGTGGLQYGANFGNIIAGIAGLLLKNKDKNTPAEKLNNGQVLVTALQQRFSTTYYTETLGIPTEKVDDFIYFAQDNAIQPYLLKPENEIELMEVLLEQSVLYKERSQHED